MKEIVCTLVFLDFYSSCANAVLDGIESFVCGRYERIIRQHNLLECEREHTCRMMECDKRYIDVKGRNKRVKVIAHAMERKHMCDRASRSTGLHY